MTPTEFQLFVLYRAPTVNLDSICDKYLSLSPPEARRRAAMHALPFPTFRLTSSQKAPYMVALKDLAAHIDSTHTEAQRDWDKSQA